MKFVVVLIQSFFVKGLKFIILISKLSVDIQYIGHMHTWYRLHYISFGYTL